MKPATTRRFAFAVSIVATIFAVSSSLAGGHSSQDKWMDEVMVETGFHHLGDGTGFPTYLVPDAEGTYWETTVWLRSSQLRKASTAHLELYLFDNEVNVVLINGKPYALPDTDATHGVQLPVAGKTILPIPLALLKKGANTIAFQANPFLPSGGPDDFEFGDVVLVLSK